MTDLIPSFSDTLKDQKLDLKRAPLEILQINTGLLCNQACKHCHLNAGPDRTQVMDKTTMDYIHDFQKQCRLKVVDITGGAPELNPNLDHLIKIMSGITETVMLRSNLSALYDRDDDMLLSILKKEKVTIVSSFPALNPSQTDSQRGKGIFDKSIKMLSQLNQIGYGQPGTGLELNLVANPAGAFLPSCQEATQKRYRQVLKDKWDIVFNNAFTFANMPLGRFKEWLVRSGNFDQYMNQLYGNFNACTIDGLMCRNLISVSWDGLLYDCDFNLAAELPKGNVKTHISQVSSCAFEFDEIEVADHCYACTAGSGFT